MSEIDSDINQIMNILGNETRRRILNLLANEPHYFNQICKELNVSQQAILKHLEILEQFKLIKSYKEKSDLAAPSRKYYSLNRALYLSIGITKNSVNIQLRDLDRINVNTNQMKNEAGLEDDVKFNNNVHLNDIFQSIYRKLKNIDEHLNDLEQKKVLLLSLRQRQIKKITDYIRSNFHDLVERDILYSLLFQGSSIRVETLSEHMNVREKEIEKHLKNLRKNLSIPFE